MTVWFKQGVIGDLTTITQKGLGRVAREYSAEGEDLFVTSTREGNHGYGSLHFIGKAFDIRPSVVPVAVRDALGPGWDVVVEGNHIHCEYDPK